MKKLLICLMALVMLLTTAALAEIQVETVPLERSVYISGATNCYYARVDGGYQLFDAQGNALSDVYSDLTAQSSGAYYEFPGSGLNYIGVLDSKGQVIAEPSYGVFYAYDDGWALGYVLEPVEGDAGDFKDSDNKWYNAIRTDVFCDGRILGSLSREEYIPTYTEGVAHGYFYVKQTSSSGFFLDKEFNKYPVADNFYTSSEFNYDYKTKTVTHVPTQQLAFTAGSALTAQDVECPVWYDDNTDSLLDLQGNVIKSGLVFDYVYQDGNYFRIRLNKLYGIMDLEGNIVVEPQYAEIANYYGIFPNGTQVAVTPEGHLHFLDEQGNVTAKAEYELSSNDYKGFSYNSPFAVVKNMGKCLVFTATKGELPTAYEDFYQARTDQQILLVQKDGLWGAIDVDGNTVLPFIHRAAPDLSNDGTLACGATESREYILYRISYGADSPDNWTVAVQSGAETEETVLAEGAWECSCGAINTGKFCGFCGAKKPEATPAPTATPAPADDGSWTCDCGSVNNGKFCPECGTKKPEVPVEPQCASCGYKPEGAAPNFCPECGAKF